MKFLMDNIFLIGLALGSGGMLLWPLLRVGANGINQVSPTEAVMLINRQHAVVLDVRDDAEYAEGHITDAIHVPLNQIEARLAQLKKYQNKAVLVHCKAGARSAKACEILTKHEFGNVYNLNGGLEAWVQAKLPTVKTA